MGQAPGYCVSIISGQLQTILDRYPNEPKPGVDRLINMLVAPTVFRILFASAALEVEVEVEVEELHRLIDIALNQ
ncbi:hypothetical protein HK44_024710 [Pseudomonas fluorescens HK44]|uniref:Uncharacterized protein n=1 Tax=Pseudomonas fluorescens HK44 TaxID=1042209 RepID=A0A010SXR6_PSEFL|nr:hypothetical protein HK44_024710 [Pseudomonas fluorescens HK44]